MCKWQGTVSFKVLANPSYMRVFCLIGATQWIRSSEENSFRNQIHSQWQQQTLKGNTPINISNYYWTHSSVNTRRKVCEQICFLISFEWPWLHRNSAFGSKLGPITLKSILIFQSNKVLRPLSRPLNFRLPVQNFTRISFRAYSI